MENQKKQKDRILIFGVIGIITLVLIIAITVKNTTQNGELDIAKDENTVDQENGANNEETEKLEFVQNNNGTKVNISEKLKEEKILEGLNINNIELKETNQISQILANVENNTEETKGGFGIVVDVIDKNNNTIVSLQGYIDKVKPGETLQLNISGTADFANAYDFIISKV